MMNIQMTQDYSQFKTLKGNRPLDENHIKKLTKSIDVDNRLDLHPIIVNGDFEVIDGQHRLRVAQILNVPIYFIKSENIESSHLVTCNVNQKSWEIETYINLFCERDALPDYLQIKKLLQETGLKPKSLLCLILGNASHSVLDFLKTGKFKFPQHEKFKSLTDNFLDFKIYCLDKRIKPISMFTNNNFTKAFRWLVLTSEFQMDIFFKKLDNKWFELKPQRNAEDWYKLLLSIYNFKNQNKLNHEFCA